MATALTKRRGDGTPLTRPPEIEEGLDLALAEGLPSLIRRAQVKDTSSPEYLGSECLVHLVRDSARRGVATISNLLLPVLLARCERTLLSKIPRGVPDADHLREEVLGAFVLILAKGCSAEDDGESDFYECRFNLAFRMLRISVVRREQAKSVGVMPLIEDVIAADDENAGRLENALRTRSGQVDGLVLAEFLDALPPEEREAVVLHYVMGYKIESKDKDEPTVATRCGVSGRTIRDRLNRARERCKQMKREDT